jgi:hypothetical protein
VSRVCLTLKDGGGLIPLTSSRSGSSRIAVDLYMVAHFIEQRLVAPGRLSHQMVQRRLGMSEDEWDQPLTSRPCAVGLTEATSKDGATDCASSAAAIAARSNEARGMCSAAAISSAAAITCLRELCGLRGLQYWRRQAASALAIVHLAFE